MKTYEKIDNDTVKIISTTTEEKEIPIDMLFDAIEIHRMRYNNVIDQLTKVQQDTDIDYGERIIPKKIEEQK